MDNETKEKEARLALKNALKTKLYLYDYIGMIVVCLLDAILCGIGLIVDANAGRSLVFLYVALAFSILAIFALAWLSALYFVDSDETPSFKRIKWTSVIKNILRFAGIGCGAFMLTSALLGSGGENSGWGDFLRYFAILLLTIESLFFLFGLWQSAWVKENPERFVTPIYSAMEKKMEPSSPSASPKKTIPEDGRTPKQALPKSEPPSLPYSAKKKPRKKEK